jgi:hypothetical protein
MKADVRWFPRSPLAGPERRLSIWMVQGTRKNHARFMKVSAFDSVRRPIPLTLVGGARLISAAVSVRRRITMGTSVLSRPQSDGYQRIANPIHTLIVLAAAGGIAFRGAMSVNQMRTALNFDRVRMYERTIVGELAMLALVLLGVALAHSPLTTVLGEHWRSLRQVLRDLGIGIAF